MQDLATMQGSDLTRNNEIRKQAPGSIPKDLQGYSAAVIANKITD